ncbi:MAG: hypothetical protein ABH863_02750 [Candidatus Micrarchaeota archaeon]
MEYGRALAAAFFSIFLLALSSSANADAVFMNCPSLFNTDITNLTAYVYYGSPPVAKCQDPPGPYVCNTGAAGTYRLMVKVNGDASSDIESCSCYDTEPGHWYFSITTPISQNYNVSVYLLNTSNVVSAEYQCSRDRKSFQGQFTVPELPPLLAPFIFIAALLIMRRGKRKARN